MGSLSLMAVSVLPCSNPLYLQKYSKKVIYVHEMIIIFIFSVFFLSSSSMGRTARVAVGIVEVAVMTIAWPKGIKKQPVLTNAIVQTWAVSVQ